MVVLAGNWWAFVLRGIVAILFGLLTFLMPRMALLTLVYLFGFYAIVNGVLDIVAAFRKIGTTAPGYTTPWWTLMLEGIVSLIAGGAAMVVPGLTAIALLYIIAAWAVVTGALEISAAIRLRRQITGEWFLALTGVLSIVFGIAVLLRPGLGALAVLLWIGAYAVLFGVLLVALGLKLRSWMRRVEHEHDIAGFPPAPLAHGH
jgi:uncharacterized membrane protein HdeD (DUF308 family)